MNSSDSCCLSGDGRCDSPGHNAKYLTYSFLDQSSDKIAGLAVTQCTDRTEWMFLKTFIMLLKSYWVNSKQRNKDFPNYNRSPCPNQKVQRENYKDINHQSDIWHVCKNFKKNLTQSAKKNSCFIINGWIKSICNRLRWCCESGDGDEQLLREKWVSILFHIQNKHSWTGSNMLFHKCCHPNIPQNIARKHG